MRYLEAVTLKYGQVCVPQKTTSIMGHPLADTFIYEGSAEVSDVATKGSLMQGCIASTYLIVMLWKSTQSLVESREPKSRLGWISMQDFPNNSSPLNRIKGLGGLSILVENYKEIYMPNVVQRPPHSMAVNTANTAVLV